MHEHPLHLEQPSNEPFLMALTLALVHGVVLAFALPAIVCAAGLALIFFVLFMGVFMDAAASPSAAAAASGFGGPPGAGPPAIASIRSTTLSGFFSSPHAAASTPCMTCTRRMTCSTSDLDSFEWRKWRPAA